LRLAKASLRRDALSSTSYSTSFSSCSYRCVT